MAELVADCGVRVYPVGRLDLNSEGLLLLTNDGALTQSLTHPSHQMEKEYHVRVNGDVKAAVPCLRQDMTVDGVLFHGARVQVLQETDRGGVLSMVICEGKNRQIRPDVRLRRPDRPAAETGTGRGCPAGKAAGGAVALPDWEGDFCAAGKVACKILQGFPAKLHFCLAFALF